MHRTKHKILFGLPLLTIPAIVNPLLFTTSCNKPFAYTWSGKFEEFSYLYETLDSTTIKPDQIWNSYFENKQFKDMICQDCVYKMNHSWRIWQPWLHLSYTFQSIAVDEHRVSWDLQIFNEEGVRILWWTIKNLEYDWVYNEYTERIEFIPLHVTPEDAKTYEIDTEFWNDVTFNLAIKVWSDDGTFLRTSESFSFKTVPSDWYKINDIMPCLVLTPHYYNGVRIVEGQ